MKCEDLSKENAIDRLTQIIGLPVILPSTLYPDFLCKIDRHTDLSASAIACVNDTSTAAKRVANVINRIAEELGISPPASVGHYSSRYSISKPDFNSVDNVLQINARIICQNPSLLTVLASPTNQEEIKAAADPSADMEDERFRDHSPKGIKHYLR